MNRLKGLFVLGIIVLGVFGTSKTAQGEGNLFSVGSELELNDALSLVESGDTIKLTADIAYTGDIIIDGKSITFDLDGYKLNVNSTFAGLTVNNGGSVQLANEGELNIIGSVFGVSAENGSNVVVTNVSIAADSSTAVYAGSDCTVLVKGAVAVKGDYSTGILINSGAGVTIDKDVTVNGTNCTGITSQIKGDITVKGNIATYGDNCTAVNAYDSITTLTIMGDITTEGDRDYGILSGGIGGIINAGGDISGKGLYFNGVYNTGSNIQINGSVKANGEECNGIFNMGGNITLEGNAVADGTGCYGADVSGGSVEIKGSIRVTGDPSVSARRSTGVTVAGVGTLVQIRQNVNAIGRECSAVISWDNGQAIVAGNITAEGSNSYGVSVSNNGMAEITGSVTVTGNSGCGANTRTGNLIIGSDVTVTGDYGKGTNAEGGSLQVNGNIKVSGYDGSGAIAQAGGLNTVEGWIEATKYIITNFSVKQITNGVSGTGAYTDYLQYSSGTSIVRVRKHIYTVSYLANGGTGTAPAQTAVNLGFTYRIAANSFTAPAGMKFKEWNVDPLGAGKSYAANGNITMPAGNLTLYAIWSFQSYTITVQNDGNGTATASTSTATMGQTISLSAVPKSGYRLKEWQSISPTGLTFNGNSFLMPASAVTVKAVFEKTYSITMQTSDNGTASADIAVAGQGDTVTLTAVPDSHYHLKEWQVITPTSLTLTGNSFTMPDEKVILKAIFEKDSYPITVQSSTGGTAEASLSSAEQGQKVTLTATPDNSYKLKEWQVLTPANLTLTGGSFEMPEEEVILKAIFEKQVPAVIDNGPSNNPTGGGSQGIGSSDVLDLPVEEAFVIIGTTGGTGTISATMTGESISEALEAAKEKRKEKEAGATGLEITAFIEASSTEEITSLNLVLHREAIQSMLQDKVDSLNINGGILSIRFDAEVLSAIYNSSFGDVTISIKSNSSLSFTDGEKGSFRAVYDINISYGSNGDINQITNMKQGTMLISIPYVLKKGEETSGLYAVYINQAGESNLIQKSYYDRLSQCVIFTTNHLSTYGIAYKGSSIKLTDTNRNWGKESIDFVVNRGLLSGTGASTFSPDRTLTREVLAKALAVLSGAKISEYRSSSFGDVALDSEYISYIEWAYAQGIMNKMGEKLFAPTKSVTREELAVILIGYAKATSFEMSNVRESYSFSDLSELSSEAGSSVNKVTQAGIMAEKKASYFKPKDEVSRAEAAVILHRYFMLTVNKQSSQGWNQDDKGQRIYYSEGKRVVGWKTLEGRKYYFNTTGILKEGWIKEGTNKYYQTAEGVIIGWWKKGSKRYYFTKNGKMVYGRWIRISKKWYYFYEDGTLAVNTNIDGYSVDKKGVRGQRKK